MTSFYEKAIVDEDLGPFFVNELGDDLEDEEWVEHIDLLADFWLAKILGEDTYYGNFIGAHVKMPHIQKENFVNWLNLFSQTADEVYTQEVAQRFKKKGHQFVQEFINSKRIGLKFS